MPAITLGNQLAAASTLLWSKNALLSALTLALSSTLPLLISERLLLIFVRSVARIASLSGRMPVRQRGATTTLSISLLRKTKRLDLVVITSQLPEPLPLLGAWFAPKKSAAS